MKSTSTSFFRIKAPTAKASPRTLVSGYATNQELAQRMAENLIFKEPSKEAQAPTNGHFEIANARFDSRPVP